MRTILVVVALFCPAIAAAQIISTLNLGCTVSANGIACNGLGSGSAMKPGTEDRPKLTDTEMKIWPGAFWERPNTLSDYLILGIGGGELLNEKAPFGHVDLRKNSVTLMPKGTPFRLRNNGSEIVEFRLIEIQR